MRHQGYEHIDRDVSWLAFNGRVLQEAADKCVPLYERIKFLAIYSSNLDEFYRVRVAALRSFRDLKKKTRRELELKPKKQLKLIRKIVQEQQRDFGCIFRKQIVPALEAEGIFIVRSEEYESAQQLFAKSYFEKEIRPYLSPIFLTGQEEAPDLKNAALYFVVTFEDNPQTLAILNIPSDRLPRFVELPNDNTSGYHITFLDDIIRFNLSNFFQRPVAQAYEVKLSRDAEIYIEDEFDPGLVLDQIREGLRHREKDKGLPTRFLYDSIMPDELRLRLKRLFQLSKHDLIPGARYHNFNDFLHFPNPVQNPQWHDAPLPPLPHPVLEEADAILDALRQNDVLLHFPYQQFDYVPRLIREAADDASVQSIKITLYRVGAKSAVVEALQYACQQGKSVIIFVEFKARFDEAMNLDWAMALKKAGAEILKIDPTLKVHAKLLLIVRQEADRLRHYAYIGTGNFNGKTARLYTDHALLTAERRLAYEVARIFDLLERRIMAPFCKQLLVSPYTLRTRCEDLIEQEIANAREGKPAYLFLKMNSLEDARMINRLYDASRAGVQIRLIVRGICRLIPGVEGMSENIEAISIVDRFLEHARVYIFANGGEELIYLASADWMTRNLDRRIEVAVPIQDPALREELRQIMELQWQDNVKARQIDADLQNAYRPANLDTPPVRAQTAIYELLKMKYQQLTEGLMQKN